MATIINEVAQKDKQGGLGSYQPFGVTFDNVVNPSDKRTLYQFYQNYLTFMRETPFIYYGDTTPTNSHIRLWVDTSTGNGL